MGSIAKRVGKCAALLFVGTLLAGALCLLPPERRASAAESAEERNEKLVVRYAMDDTATANGNTIAATKWDKDTGEFVAYSECDATIVNQVQGRRSGAISSVAGKEGSALSFTESAHARASFHLPSDATGMTVSLWVKNINTYWSSLIEFWDGKEGGRFGKGTMQGNRGRQNEGDAWSSNCSAHSNGKFDHGGAWDSFFIIHNNTNGDNGGAYVDHMAADTWYQVTFTVTANEMKAYRNGELKQIFNDGDAQGILSSIMTAAKNQTGGKLGIRLSLDENNGDILDELRIYNGAMTEDEVLQLYFDYDPIAGVLYDFPDYYDANGLTYPDLLIGGATEVTDGANGQKTGTTKGGVTYTYSPITAPLATVALDEQGVLVHLTLGELSTEKTVKFRRDLGLAAKELGYKLTSSGENIAVPVPETGYDVTAKVPAGTDLSKVTAGTNSTQPLAGDATAANYEAEFTYNPALHIATVRCGYKPFPGHDVFYTIHFVEKSTATLSSILVKGGIEEHLFTEADFEDGAVKLPVSDLENFSLTVSVTPAEGATVTGGENKTFTASDLEAGLSIEITSENGEKKTYVLEPVVLSAESALSALSIEGYTLSPAFAETTLEYSVSGSAGEEAKILAALTATPKAQTATVQTVLDKTAGVILITVTAENGSATVYTVRLSLKDANAALSSLTVGGTPLAGFAPETLEYTVKYKGTLPEVAAVAASAKASVSVGEATAEGKVSVTVTAESGKAQTYTLTFVPMSSDASLKKLTVGGAEVTLNGTEGAYTAPAGTLPSELSVKAETAEGATAVYALSGDKLTVTVTAEDGTEKTYIVTVSFASASFGEGTAEDKSPQESGCGAAAGEEAFVLAVLCAGAGLLLLKKRCKH